LGLTKNHDPEKIEKDLLSLARKEDLDSISMTLIYHGRKICQARKPKCPSCVVNKLCPSSIIFMNQ
jgi:endonuclease-3